VPEVVRVSVQLPARLVLALGDELLGELGELESPLHPTKVAALRISMTDNIPAFILPGDSCTKDRIVAERREVTADRVNRSRCI
jgi:hypothetical protein